MKEIVVDNLEALEKLTYGMKVKTVMKGGKIVESVLMLDLHDLNNFQLLFKIGSSFLKKTIKVQNVNQISLDVQRGNLKNLITEEVINYVSLFMTAESLDLVFQDKYELDCFLYVLNETLTSSN